LKIIQEVGDADGVQRVPVTYLGEKLRWNHFVAFMCILAAVAFTFLPKK